MPKVCATHFNFVESRIAHTSRLLKNITHPDLLALPLAAIGVSSILNEVHTVLLAELDNSINVGNATTHVREHKAFGSSRLDLLFEVVKVDHERVRALDEDGLAAGVGDRRGNGVEGETDERCIVRFMLRVANSTKFRLHSLSHDLHKIRSANSSS